jgi:hypothetical protein
MDHPMPYDNIRFTEAGKMGIKKAKCYTVSLDEADTAKPCIIIPAIYESIESIDRQSKPPFIAKLNNKFGVVDGSNKILIPFDYDTIWYYTNTLVKVKLDKEFFYVDYQGTIYRK